MKIYAPSHTLTADIDLQQGAVVHHELGGEHYVRLPFTLPTAVTFPIGSYVNVKGFGRFEVTEENQPKFNAQTGGYDYDLQLDASYMKWKNKLLRYRPLNAKGSETSFRLTATIGTHLNVVTDNLRRLGEADPSFLYDGKEAYVSALKGVADDAKNRHAFIAYEGTDILSALNRIAEAFGCEWWVEDNVICMGRCEMATDTVVLEMHDAIEQMSTQGSKGVYANRLIVFGSERNLPANYREATSPDIVTDGVVQRRLMLPEKDAPKGYIQAPATTEKNAVEAVVVMEDIYPKVECFVKTLTSYESESYDKEGNKVAETFYRVTDTAFKFTKEMILPDKKLHIVFQSGRMNGMDFEAEYSQENNWFEIVANDTYGRKLPDKDLHPAQEDEFILYNWDSSKAADTGIIEKAEAKLLEAARKQLDKMQKDGTNYECTLSSYWAEKTFRTSAGEYTHYAVGQPVTLKDEARFPQGRKSRIIGYEIKLDIPYDTPRYIVGESPFQSRTERLQQQIDSLTVGGKTYQGTGGSSSGGGQYIYLITQTSQVAPSDTNVFSAARTELDFVHKKKADTIEAGHTFAARQQFQQGADFGSSVTVEGDLLTRGKSTLSGGADFGSTFVEGIAGGRGGRIDDDGHAELESLTLRRFLEVPELRYNRVTVMAGVQWRGAGGGIVLTATRNNGGTGGVLVLKLEEGEMPAIQVGDLCMGIFHSTHASDNEKEDADSGTGRFQMKGFGTVYFEITGTMLGIPNMFKYTLRPASDKWTKQLHPKAGMHFAVYGNRTVPERQDSRYSTLQYERFLKGVNDWEFGERNIMAQFGDLSNLTIGGKPMAGYSAYINNLYMSGVIDQFERLDPKLDIASSTGTYIGASERSELLIRLKDGYGTNASADVTHWAVERETGNTTADREWNTLHPNLSYDSSAAGAALSLTSADLGGNDSAVFRFSATYKGKAVTDILVLRRAAKDGQDGADGKDGAPGAPGKDGLNGQNGADGHGVAFSWSKNDYYSEAQLNEWLAVGADTDPWYADTAGITIPAKARVGDYISASFRAKDTKNVHTVFGELTEINRANGSFRFRSLAHSVIPKGETGAQGVEGAIYRVTQWSKGVKYNDGSLVEPDGHRYVDLVTVREELQEGVTQYHFVCTGCHTSTASDCPKHNQPSANWQEANNQRPIYTPLLLAKGAVIDFLQGNTIKVTETIEGVNEVVATLGNGEYPLYVGADTPDNAPFRVKRDGHMDSTSGNIGGWSITPSAIASANGSSVLDAVTGNIACSGMVIRRPVHITDDNADSYFTNVEGTKRYLNLFKSGTLIILGTRYKTPGNITVAGQPTYHLRFPGTVNNTEIGDAFLEASQYLGVTVFLFNLSSSTSYNGAIRIEGRLRKKGTTENRGWITLNPKASIKLTCVNDALNIVWEYEITDNTFTNIPTINLPDRIPGSPVAPERVQ